MKALDIGIDIGGTKTHLRASPATGEPRDLVLPTADWRVRDWEQDAVELLTVVQRLAAGTPLRAIAVGAHGCDDESECEAFQASLVRHAPCPALVVNDAELLPAALGYTGQIGLVAGTGSIAVCRDPAIGMMVAGGWGWIIGDEGSASGLMREAARAVNLHLDGGGSVSDPLVPMLFNVLGIQSATRIGSAIARLGGASTLGGFARIIFEADEAGSRLARKVIDDGAWHLAELVGRLKRNGASADRVVAGGGVIVAQPKLAEAFLKEVSRRFGDTVMASIYAGPPVDGACQLAANMTTSLPVVADTRAAGIVPSPPSVRKL